MEKFDSILYFMRDIACSFRSNNGGNYVASFFDSHADQPLVFSKKERTTQKIHSLHTSDSNSSKYSVPSHWTGRRSRVESQGVDRHDPRNEWTHLCQAAQGLAAFRLSITSTEHASAKVCSSNLGCGYRRVMEQKASCCIIRG